MMNSDASYIGPRFNTVFTYLLSAINIHPVNGSNTYLVSKNKEKIISMYQDIWNLIRWKIINSIQHPNLTLDVTKP